MRRLSDILIIGAGPSGLRAARRLAESGLQVRVLEKKAAVGRDVVCTGIIGWDSFNRFGLDASSVVGDMKRVRMISPAGTSILYEHPSCFAAVVDRELFDQALAREARAAGAEIETGVRVDDVRVASDRIEADARTGGGETAAYGARLLVLAGGVDHSLQKKLGLGYAREFLQGAQVETDAVHEDITTLLVGREAAPGGFAWSVPAGSGKVRIGLVSRRACRPQLERLIERLVGEGAARPEPAAIRSRPIAQGLLEKTCGNRVVAIGEAAGQVKTTTGGGIAYGLLGAEIAAEVVAGCFKRGSFGAADLAPYEERWRKALRKEIVFGRRARLVCSRLSDAQVESLFRLARTDGIIPIIRTVADFDRHSGLLLALAGRLSIMRSFRHLGLAFRSGEFG